MPAVPAVCPSVTGGSNPQRARFALCLAGPSQGLDSGLWRSRTSCWHRCGTAWRTAAVAADSAGNVFVRQFSFASGERGGGGGAVRVDIAELSRVIFSDANPVLRRALLISCRRGTGKSSTARHGIWKTFSQAFSTKLHQ